MMEKDGEEKSVSIFDYFNFGYEEQVQFETGRCEVI